jgi:acyl homoserine lactone synthase
MIKIVYASDLYRRPFLAASMYRDRASQFKERLGWEAVSLDDKGLEFDAYDDHNPLYVIIEDEHGEHCGSGRLMPTTGPTMAADHFSDLFGGVALSSASIWEVTRLCVSPRPQASAIARRAPAALFWAGYDIAMRSGVDFFVAVYFERMQRIWRAIGAEPEVLGTRETPEGTICGGLWELTPETRDTLKRRAGALAETAPQLFPSANRFQLMNNVTPIYTKSKASEETVPADAMADAA